MEIATKSGLSRAAAWKAVAGIGAKIRVAIPSQLANGGRHICVVLLLLTAGM